MRQILALSAALLLPGCASVNLERADWCFRKGGINWTIPLENLPHQKRECKSREILNRLIR